MACIAVAGAGKTSVLIARIANLIRVHGVAPSQILAVTFTRAATRQMKDRLAAMIGEEPAKRVAMRTFHGLAYSILTEVIGKVDVWGEAEINRAIGGILRELGMQADSASTQNAATDISRFRGRLDRLEDFVPASCSPEKFREILERYQRAKKDAGVWDFDDMLERTLDLLQTTPPLREKLRNRWRFVLVDEFQDTNLAQLLVIEQLVSDGHDIMVVGDDDQAIYGWRGSEVRFILDFPRRHDGCKVAYLSTNFRTTDALLAPAAQLIERNKTRFKKKLAAATPGGKPPVVVRPGSLRQEDDAIIELLVEAHRSGRDLNEYAALYRQHMQAFGLLQRLDQAGVPYRVLSGDADPFAQWPARDALAYIRWAWGEASMEEIARVLKRPLRYGVSKELVGQLEASVRRPADALAWLERNAPSAARDLKDGLDQLRRVPAEDAIDFIRNGLRYDQYVIDFCQWSGSDRGEAYALLESIQGMPEAGQPSKAYLDLARAVQEKKKARRTAEADEDGAAVTLATFHAAKGLEWANVYIKGAIEGFSPTKAATEGGSVAVMEEERRLFYVAMTRAKERLTIFCPRTQNGGSTVPSRFLIESGLMGTAHKKMAGPLASSGSRPAVKKKRRRPEAAPPPENVVLDLSASHLMASVNRKRVFVPMHSGGRYYMQPTLDGKYQILFQGQLYRQCAETDPDDTADALAKAGRR